MKIGVCPDDDLVAAFCEGRLRAADARAVSSHVETCGDCRAITHAIRSRELASPSATAGRTSASRAAATSRAAAASRAAVARPSATEGRAESTPKLGRSSLLLRVAGLAAVLLVAVVPSVQDSSGTRVVDPLFRGGPTLARIAAPRGGRVAARPSFVAGALAPIDATVYRLDALDVPAEVIARIKLPAPHARVPWPSERPPLAAGRYLCLLEGEGLVSRRFVFEVHD